MLYRKNEVNKLLQKRYAALQFSMGTGKKPLYTGDGAVQNEI